MEEEKKSAAAEAYVVHPGKEFDVNRRARRRFWSMPRLRPKLRCYCITFFIGFVLFFAGAIAAVVCGLMYVKPALRGARFETGTCTVARADRVLETLPCSCGKYCRAEFPCMKIHVNVLGEGGQDVTQGTSVLLHSNEDNLEKFSNSNRIQCSASRCSPSNSRNEEFILEWYDRYGLKDKNFACFYSPRDSVGDVVDVIAERDYDSLTVFHGLFWPLLSVVVGVLLMVISYRLFNREKTDKDPQDIADFHLFGLRAPCFFCFL